MKLVLSNAMGDAFNDAEITILRCLEEHCLPNKKRENEIRSYYSIHFITYGEGTIVCKRGDEYRLKRGDVFVNFPNAYLDYGPSRTNPWSYIWLSFDGNSKMDDVLELCGITREKPFCRIENFNKCYSLINSMLEARDYGELQDIKCYGYFLEILCEMIDSSRPASSKQKQLLFSAMSFISANMTLKLSLAEIAASVCCSQSYLSSIFSKYLKSTPIEFQQKFRIAVACEKLRKDTDESIEQIAHRVGYDDPLYFSRVFKKLKGMSPRQYRQQRIDENPFEGIPYVDALYGNKIF